MSASKATVPWDTPRDCPVGQCWNGGTSGRLGRVGQLGRVGHRGQTYGLELKVDGGRLSPVQRTAHALMQSAGAVVEVATGLDAALSQLERWGFLQGQAQ